MILLLPCLWYKCIAGDRPIPPRTDSETFGQPPDRHESQARTTPDSPTIMIADPILKISLNILDTPDFLFLL